MGRTWHKPHYVKSDYDPVTHDLRPGAMAPGVYCEVEATFDLILTAEDRAALRAVADEFTGDF